MSSSLIRSLSPLALLIHSLLSSWDTGIFLSNIQDVLNHCIYLLFQPEQVLNDKPRASLSSESPPPPQLLSTSQVAIGIDTRPSSVRLAAAARLGIDCCGAQLIDFDLSTTPQLHYYVRCLNTNSAYGSPSEKGYLDKLSQDFLKLKGERPNCLMKRFLC